jgi:hypothetical protein
VKGPRGVSWAGLLSGPAAWGVSTQGNYALAIPQCLSGVHPTPWVAVLLALVALAGGALSFLAYRHTTAQPGNGERKPRTEVFYSLLSVGIAVLFALVILLQGFAGMVFTGCER